MNVKDILLHVFDTKIFTLQDAYDACSNYPSDSVRGRIYENIGIAFERVDRGIYTTIAKNCVLIEGDGRDLSFLADDSIDCIITDHPWLDKKSNNGGDRKLAEYNCFQYEPVHFIEKARVLKKGSFLCEIIPAENENNYKYLYQIKIMAEQAGLLYYAKVPWEKGTFVSNTGRKSKNTEEIMIFSKGKARPLRLDAKKTVKTGSLAYMSGTNGMLPTKIVEQAVPNAKKSVQSEKPVGLFEQLLEYVTKENEVVLDQFAGSGAVGEACIKKNRKCILIEKAAEQLNVIKSRLNMQPIIFGVSEV